jgi:hypothetical protein
VVFNNTAPSANRIACCAIRAKHRGISIEVCEVLGRAWVHFLVGAVEDIVGLVGGVANIAPKKGSSN